MKKYGFTILGDAPNEPVVLFDCTFYANDNADVVAFRDKVFREFDNPMRIGTPIFPSDVFLIQE